MASRKQQIKKIQAKAQQLYGELDLLIEELEESYENMPESVQYGERGEKAQERINTLSEWRDNLGYIVEEEDV